MFKRLFSNDGKPVVHIEAAPAATRHAKERATPQHNCGRHDISAATQAVRQTSQHEQCSIDLQLILQAAVVSVHLLPHVICQITWLRYGSDRGVNIGELEVRSML
jgi:hypothetical protein